MKSIIEEIYYGNVSEADRSFKYLKGTKEFINMDKYYNSLVNLLSDEQNEIFEKFCEFNALFDDIIRIETYKNGVKLGMSLILELLNYKF